MGLESTMICIDNSEFMRNGDYIPTRLQAQQDAVNTVCRVKLMANPENNVGLLTLAKTEVLATLTTDAGKILTSLHRIQPNGYINLLTGVRIAHLALKHRQSKNHKMRIVIFVGSPIEADDKEVLKLAKKLKKENVTVDVVNFGETDQNQNLLELLVNTINGKDGSGSHLVTIPPSPHLADALRSSPVIQGEDGTAPAGFSTGSGFDFVDPNEDPELALALRVSMEEQRQRQQEEERRAAQSSESTGDAEPDETATGVETTEPSSAITTTEGGVASEEDMLRQALAMSMESGVDTTPTIPASATGGFPDFAAMTEEEQIAYAMQISLQGCQSKVEPMEVDDSTTKKDKIELPEPDFSEVMADQEFLNDVLKNLPGVNPESQVVQDAVGSLASQDKEKKDKKKEQSENKDEKK